MLKTGNDIVENKILIKDEFLDSVINEIFFDGVRIFFIDHTVKKYFVYNPDRESPVMQMHFSLQGTNTAKSHVSGETYKIDTGRHNLIYIPHMEFDFKIETRKARIFGIQFKEKFTNRLIDENEKILYNFWQKIEKKEEALLMTNSNLFITPDMNRIIFSITNSGRTGHLKKLFLESRIIELFMLQLEQAYNNSNCFVQLSKYDIDKLYSVKEMLDKNILSTISFREISYMNGLNEFKLKKGFKKLFGKSVFSYLNDLRMDYAKSLIVDEKKKIFEVAEILGYSESHHFSYAFKKKFGILPSALK
jgi:AraC-like DNA-binding protein